MKFVTINDGSRDGRVHIAARDGTRVVEAENVRSLQEALDNWAAHQATWQAQYERLNAGEIGRAYEAGMALSPLPRAWQWLDGSAFETHALLIQKAWGMPESGLPDLPLMYQGISDKFLPPTGEASFPSEADGIDFEGEYGVILDDVPMGTAASEAGQYIRLIVLINDWSLRAIGPQEFKTGFGWLRCKPACAVAPFAVTPDELGDGWQNHRVCLPLNVALNGAEFGRTNGAEMHFGFDELIAHAAYSRDLPAGTILGSGTVSNADYAQVGSSCIAERQAIELIATGAPTTPFLKHGDRVEMQVRGGDGGDVFGALNQSVRIVG